MFSQTSEYALRAMICLASLQRTGTPAASSERISHLTRIPPGYLCKIMRLLVVGNLVTSQRGPRGGFTLARAPEAITLFDVVEVLEPMHAPDRRETDTEEDPGAPLRERLARLSTAMRESLRGTTLAQVLDEMREQSTDAA